MFIVIELVAMIKIKKEIRKKYGIYINFYAVISWRTVIAKYPSENGTKKSWLLICSHGNLHRSVVDKYFWEEKEGGQDKSDDENLRFKNRRQDKPSSQAKIVY
jgi:hypothetical protein